MVATGIYPGTALFHCSRKVKVAPSLEGYSYCSGLETHYSPIPMAGKTGNVPSLTPRELALPGKALPPAIPLIISCQDSWDPDSCKLKTGKQDGQHHGLQLVEDALELLRTINKPLAVLSICGPYRSGKSYFMSRLMGRPEAFQLGHGMRACTRGIWMATTILECQQFAIVLLDTEGIDAIRASETTAMSLLTLTTLLSSYLIYNSKKVPQKVDLNKMRCFTQLSTSLLAQKGQSMSAVVTRKFFPRFLWLLRDVALDMTNRQGELISPTAFLHTRVLASASGELTDLGKSLCSLFPSLECHTLPTPAIKPKLIRNIVKLQDQLNPVFNTAVDELIDQVLSQVAPKSAIDGVSVVDGPALAALACAYVNAINIPGALPDLEQGWFAVIKLKLKEFSDQLVSEYEREMEASLRGNLPMEESNLTRIHEQTLSRKRKSLQQETHRLDPLGFSSDDQEPLQSRLEQVVVWRNEEGKVVGGVLFQFTTQNYSTSKQQCEEVFKQLVKKYEVYEKYRDAIQNSKPLDIEVEMETIDIAYNERAVGPAATEILEKGHRELNQLRDFLKKIPGPPTDICRIGRGPDRIKLSWCPPKVNPEACESYVVWKKEEGQAAERVGETKKTKMLITGLKSDKYYSFQVKATNDIIKSISEVDVEGTTPTKAETVAVGAAFVGGVSLFAGGLLLSSAAPRSIKYTTGIEVAAVITAFASIPLNIVVAPVVAPAIVVYLLKNHGDELDNYEGDLTPESDEEK